MQDTRDELSSLFAAYREALPDPEPGAGFTPGMWARIDAKRRETAKLSILARRMVALGAALSLATVALVYVPAMRNANPALTSTYVEVLSEDHQQMIEVDASEI
jgi:hypothetical protein